MDKIKKCFYIFSIGILFFFVSCNSDNVVLEDFNQELPVDNDIDEDDIAKATVTIDATDKIEISPMIFGINNDWSQIPETSFVDFSNSLVDVGYTMMRFPGGWESEYYDWNNNSTPNWNNSPNVPGVSISTLKLNVHNFNIVIPTAQAMNKAIGTSDFNLALEDLKEIAEKAIIKSGPQEIKIVEIGNEWWLQWGGGLSRSEKLVKYSYIAMNIAEHINNKFPEKKFKLLVNGDYTKPEEFTVMKNLFTKAYDVIDGVALHTYAGYSTDTHNVSDLESRIIACSNNFNADKNYVYLSEWMPSRDYNERKLYMEAANLIPNMFQIYARAGADAAAYWPPVNASIPGLGFFNWNFTMVYPVGQIFGELYQSFHGEVVKVTSETTQLAVALNDENTLVMFIAGGDGPYTKTTIKINGFKVSYMENIKRFVPVDYSETNKAAPYIIQDASAQLNIETNELLVDLNKEGAYQIYKITLKGVTSN